MTVSTVALRELHRIHQQLTDLRDRLARGPKQVHARTVNVTQAEQKLAQAQAELKAARVASDQKQLLLKSSEARILDLQVKQNACSTNREYQALKDQIAADKMANSVMADEILEGMDSIEQLKAGIGGYEAALAKAKEELAKIQQTVREQEAHLKSEVARVENELREAEKVLPPEFREPYNRVVKARGEDAMAPVESDVCGGCYYQITANVMNELAMGRAVFCKSCGRLLYLPEDRTPGR